jgi:hypothetical protein
MIKSPDSDAVSPLASNFYMYEVRCRCCGEIPTNIQHCIVFAEQLQMLRSAIGKPFIVTSWYRCPNHNAAVGGSKESYHTKGRAIDFYIPGMTVKQMFTELVDRPFGGIGAYPTKGIIHIDNRITSITRWVWTPEDGYVYSESPVKLLSLLEAYHA